MKRREFMQGLIAAVVVPAMVIKWIAVDVPRKVIFARKTEQYPGRVIPLKDIPGQGKWSG